MQDTAREVGMNLWVIYTCVPLYMDKQRQDDQLELTYNSFVLIQDVALKTYQERWMIETVGKRETGRSVLMMRMIWYRVFWTIGLVGRVFTNGLGAQGSIPGKVILKTQNMVINALLNIQHYKVLIKGKWSNPGKEVVPSPIPWYSSYWKRSLQVALNYGHQLFLLNTNNLRTALFDL